MMAERGVAVTHTTIMRWVLQYVPKYEKRWARYARPVNPSWRVDETYIAVRGRPHYLYRAVDRYGKSVDHLLCADRSREAAQAFFRKAVVTHSTAWPCKVNLDGNAASHRAMRLLSEEDPRWQSVIVRARRYLNNIVEQDHRAIKRRCAPMLGFKSFPSAETTQWATILRSTTWTHPAADESILDISANEEPTRRAALLGHTKLESTVRYLGIEVDDALEISEQTEV